MIRESSHLSCNCIDDSWIAMTDRSYRSASASIEYPDRLFSSGNRRQLSNIPCPIIERQVRSLCRDDSLWPLPMKVAVQEAGVGFLLNSDRGHLVQIQC